jgi:hypothetical protein
VLNYVANVKDVSRYLNVGTPSNQTYVPYDVRPGMIDQWQLSVEHQFGNTLMGSLAYVGSHAYNLQFPTDINQITNPTLLQEIAAQTLPAGETLQSVRPFPYWGSLGGNNYNAISNYNGLQAAVNKHFSGGLLFGFNYVWSHMLDEMDSSGWANRGGTQDWQNGSNPGANYGNSNFDIPNAFKGYVAYDLPFGKGKTFLNTNTLVDEVLGGWKLSGTELTQSGNPFTVTVNSANYVANITGCGNNCVSYPNVIGDPNVANPSALHGWFNAAAFATSSPAGTFAFGNEARNSLRGPRLTVFNLSLGKTFAITERVHLEFRSDWVNVFNHPSFTNPGDACNLGTNGVCIPGANNFGLVTANSSTSQEGGIAVAPRSGQLVARITF